MNKADLKAKWSKYCDTDKLVDDVAVLLRKYSHRNTEHGICTVLDEYFTNKEPLIKLLSQSSHYIGDMRVALTKSFDRAPNRDEIFHFFGRNNHMLNGERLLKFVDEDGKRMEEYLPTGKMCVKISELSTSKGNEKLNNFHPSGATKKTRMACDELKDYLSYFTRSPYVTVQNDFKASLSVNSNVPLLKAGTKMSRAFNKVCTHYGIDKFDPQTVTATENGKTVTKTVYPYNKIFAQYADLVSDLAREMQFIISLNPLDYLTMSLGVSWSSCHNIRAGGYMGGCMSYMMDGTSMVTYVVSQIEDNLHMVPKAYRQMFHYNDNLFVQSRLYPQGNDGATNLYDKFRGFVTEVFGELLNANDDWNVNDGGSATCNHIESTGCHYPDYLYNRSCRAFYHRTKANEVANHTMTIGHQNVCVYCGRRLDAAGRLAHSTCNLNG